MTDSRLLDGDTLSVVLLCWNHERFVEQCLRSVAAATTSETQVVVIDNGSDDNSLQVIRDVIGDLQVNWQVIDNPSNVGIARALNQGVEIATGRFVAFLATDDLVHPDRFRIQVAALDSQSDEVVLTCGDVERVDSEGSPLGVSLDIDTVSRRFNLDTDPRDLIFRGLIPQPISTLYRTSVVRSLNGFDIRFYVEDRPMLFKCSLIPRARFIYVPNALTCYRVLSGSASRNSRIKLRHYLEMYGTLIDDHDLRNRDPERAALLITSIRERGMYERRVLEFASMVRGSRLSLLRFGLLAGFASSQQRVRALVMALVPIWGRRQAIIRHVAPRIQRHIRDEFELPDE